MKRIWMRMVEWVEWRWNLPSTQRMTWDMLFRLGEKHYELERRCEKAEARAANLEAYVKDWDAQRALDAGVPGLTPAQIERLAWLAEELGEAMQAAGKILRHGYDCGSPFGGATNRVRLEKELAHVRVAIDAMESERDVRPGDIRSWMREKRGTAPQWMHHQSPRRRGPVAGDPDYQRAESRDQRSGVSR